MTIRPPFLPVTLALLAALASPLAAENLPPAVTAEDPAIKLEYLELMLDPLTKDELAAEATAWRDIVKAHVQEISETGIAAMKAENDASLATLNNRLAELQNTKSAALKRFDSVLSEFEEKGGDPDEYRAYSQAVSGINIRNGDTSSKISAFRGWLTSEEGGKKWVIRGAIFVAILIAFWIIASMVSRIVVRITDRHLSWSALLERFINKLVSRVILFIGFLVALSSVGVNVSAILALIGGGAFIIGLALQDTLGNFASGLMLLVYRPFDVGHFVEIAGVTGTVDNVSLVSTVIRTPDNKVILVPNNDVWGQVITNATASAERRVDMVFGIGYGDDMAKAQQILETIIARHEKILTVPAPVIKVNELADSSVNFVCRPWSATSDYWDVFWDVTRQVKEEFDAQGISIPFPQRDVHIHQSS